MAAGTARREIFPKTAAMNPLKTVKMQILRFWSYFAVTYGFFAVPAGDHGSDLSVFVNLQKNTPRFLCKLLPDSALFVGCYENTVLFLSHPAIAFSEEKGYNNKVCLPADTHRNQIRRTAADQILTRYGEWSL